MFVLWSSPEDTDSGRGNRPSKFFIFWDPTKNYCLPDFEKPTAFAFLKATYP